MPPDLSGVLILATTVRDQRSPQYVENGPRMPNYYAQLSATEQLHFIDANWSHEIVNVPLFFMMGHFDV